MTRKLISLAALALCAACASTQPATEPGAAPTSPSTPGAGDAIAGSVRSRQQDRLTADDIAAAHVSTAYDAVQRLRPAWLRSVTTATTTGAVTVRYNGRTIGGPNELRTINAADVISMQYLNPSTARSTLGGEYEYGAIVIVGR
jgi:hypothetical protein